MENGRCHEHRQVRCARAQKPRAQPQGDAPIRGAWLTTSPMPPHPLGNLRVRWGTGYFRSLMLASIPGSPESSKTSGTPQRMERPPGGYTVLVVDDEEAVRRLASRMLTWGGYQVLEARHGREALATVEQHAGPIHLVLTDIKMPGMNGRELGREIERRWPDKRILYMSGFASEVFQGGLLEAGAPFLAKPFTQEDLTGKVRVLLEAEA
jgi:two-component system, cell cycle sensor histidine kinase and response regulator CckA